MEMSKDVLVLINQGQAAYNAGNLVVAKHLFLKVLEVEQTNLTATYFLAAIAEDAGDFVNAAEYYRTVINQDPTMRQAYFQLANALHMLGKQWDAISVLHEAEKQFPDDREVMHMRGQLAARHLPGWHLPMLADNARNDAYEKAINAVVKPGDIVLDIGTGSGLLAMMAVRAGAAHVYACEVEEVMAELAQQIIHCNGFQDKITIVNKHSTQLKIGEDLPCKADVLVSEIFDRAVIGEGVLPTIHHAWQELLQPGARVIPESATLYGALVECPHLQRFHNIEEVNGFDLTPMNILAQPLVYKDALISLAESEMHRVLSEPFVIRKFNFRSSPDTSFESECPVSVVQPGQADSLLMWFDLQLVPGVVFSTRDTRMHDHWRQATQVLLEKADCKKGQTVTLSTQFQNYFDFSIRT